MNASNNTVDMEAVEEIGRQMQEESKFTILPRILRGLGAVTLIASVSIFMFQGWDSGNDIYRYLLLLGHTVGLAVIGFMSGHWLKESKGARLLLALALASIPANFAIMGGFMYDLYGVKGAAANIPDFVNWQAGDPETALTVIGIAAALLLPVMWLGFMVLSRNAAGRFSFIYMLSNAAILVPVRDTLTVGWMVLVLAVLVLFHVSRARKGDASLKTKEGLIAQVIQFLPLGVILGRAMWLYAGDAFLWTVMAVLAYMIVRQTAEAMEKDSRMRSALEFVSLAPAWYVAIGAADIVMSVFPNMQILQIPVLALVFAMLIMDVSIRSEKHAAHYRRLAAAVVVGGALANLVLYGGVIMAAICLAAGLGVSIYGYMVEQRLVFVLGVITLLTGIGYQVSYAIEYFDLGSWGSLAALGVTAIIAGSLIERHGVRVKARLIDWGRQFRSWEN